MKIYSSFIVICLVMLSGICQADTAIQIIKYVSVDPQECSSVNLDVYVDRGDLDAEELFRSEAVASFNSRDTKELKWRGVPDEQKGHFTFEDARCDKIQCSSRVIHPSTPVVLKELPRAICARFTKSGNTCQLQVVDGSC